MKLRFWLAPVLMLAGQPAFAANDMRDMSLVARQPAAFAGAQVRLGLGGAGALTPVARLAAGMTYQGIDSRGVPVGAFTPPTLELGFSKSGRPDLYLAGQPLSQAQRQLGFAPVGAALLAIGGLALVGAGGIMASGGKQGSSKDAANPPPNQVVCLGIGVCPPPPGK